MHPVVAERLCPDAKDPQYLILIDILDAIKVQAAELAKSGCGVAILPECIAKARHLVPVPLSPVHADEVCLLYRGESRNIKAMQTITHAIKQAFNVQQMVS